MTEPQKFYRIYEQLQESGWNGVRVRCFVETWYLVRKTPCGWWISPYTPNYHGWDYAMQENKWIGRDHVKKYAYPSMEEAIVGYRMRKRREIKILKSRLKVAEAAYELAQKPDFFKGDESVVTYEKRSLEL